MHLTSSRSWPLLVALTPVAALLSACGDTAAPERSAAPSASATHSSSGEQEVRTLTPRALVAHEKGLSLIDVGSGEVLDEVADPGFLRLNPAGDGQHVMVTDGDRFRVYDTGLHSAAHGDHAHHYVSSPGLSTTEWPALKAGHVVAHNGFTTLFADGSGAITSVVTDQIDDPDAAVQRHRTPDPHHGVALVLDDGSLLTTEGTEEKRSSVVVLDGEREVTRTDACPGVHGEAAAARSASGHDVVALGCEDGPVVLRDGEFHKVAAPDAYARTGNLAGHPDSPVVLGDYKVDRDAELERPTRVSLIDTAHDTLRTVELGSSYWFRSLARGPGGEALVLTYDGSLRVIDPKSGKQTESLPVIAPWREKSDWQQPGPVLRVVGEHAYVVDSASQELVVVHLEDASVEARHPIPAGTSELVVTTGTAEHAPHPEHQH